MQRVRKKRYCSRIGCVARKLLWAPGEPWFEGTKVELVVLLLAESDDRSDVNGGSGGGGSVAVEGVAFSIRAQVR